MEKQRFWELHKAAGWLSRCRFAWSVSPGPVWVCAAMWLSLGRGGGVSGEHPSSYTVLPVCEVGLHGPSELSMFVWPCSGLLDSTEVAQSKFNF